MAAKVPKFGAWGTGENYTVYFDNARKIKSNGAMINPNDPEEYSQNEAPAAPSTQIKAESQGQQSKVPQFGAWDNGGNYTACFENARKTNNREPENAENEPQLNQNLSSHDETPAETRPATVKPEPQEARSKVPQFGAWEGGDVAYTACFDNIRKTKNGTAGTEETSNGPQLNRDVNPQKEPPAPEVHAKVPQFGAWGGVENVGYTAFFDNARKNKVEPGEPKMNRDVGERTSQPSAATKARSEENMGQGKVRSRTEQRSTKEESHLTNSSRGSTASVAGSETHHRQGRQTPGGQSPLHSRGGKPQSKSGFRGNQTPEKAATIPQFGVWHKDPAQADGFTGAFVLARENRMTPLNKNTPASHHQQSQHSSQGEKKGCCFSCFG